MVGLILGVHFNMEILKQSLQQAREQIKRVAQDLPDQDAYAIVYTVLVDLAKTIDTSVASLDIHYPQAQVDAHNNHEQLPNRAKVWLKSPSIR